MNSSERTTITTCSSLPRTIRVPVVGGPLTTTTSGQQNEAWSSHDRIAGAAALRFAVAVTTARLGVHGFTITLPSRLYANGKKLSTLHASHCRSSRPCFTQRRQRGYRYRQSRCCTDPRQ